MSWNQIINNSQHLVALCVKNEYKIPEFCESIKNKCSNTVFIIEDGNTFKMGIGRKGIRKHSLVLHLLL